jgi:hypothetical protein
LSLAADKESMPPEATLSGTLSSARFFGLLSMLRGQKQPLIPIGQLLQRRTGVDLVFAKVAI